MGRLSTVYKAQKPRNSAKRAANAVNKDIICVPALSVRKTTLQPLSDPDKRTAGAQPYTITLAEDAISTKKRCIARTPARKTHDASSDSAKEARRQEDSAEAARQLDTSREDEAAACPLMETEDAEHDETEGATQHSSYQQGVNGRQRRAALKHFKLEDLDLLSDEVVKREMEGVETRVASIPSVCDLSSATEREAAFDLWYYEIRAGFNLLFAGRGSKKALLDKFAAERLRQEAAVAVVHGYHPSTTLKSTLATVADAIASVCEDKGAGAHSSSVPGLLAYITQRREPPPPPVYLLLHSIDGVNLRARECQVALSELAVSGSVRLVASINHVNASLLWDADVCANFGWLGHAVDTGLPYVAEAAHRPRALQRDAGASLHRSAPVVLRSLTPGAQRVFRLLAEMQLNEQAGAKGGAADSSGAANTGISFTAWYQRCRLSFLVSSELALRSMLTEFKDHALVTSAANNQRHGAGGQHELRIPLSADVLRGILAGMDL